MNKSNPNNSNDRRIGLNIQYLATHVKQLKHNKDSAICVRGVDKFKNFLADKPAIKDLDSNHLILLSRYVEGGGDNRAFLRVFCSKFLNLLCRIILSNSIKDYTSSIFIMKKNVLNETTFISNGHGEFFIEFLFFSASSKNFFSLISWYDRIISLK